MIHWKINPFQTGPGKNPKGLGRLPGDSLPDDSIPCGRGQGKVRFVNGGGLGNLIRKRCRTKPILLIYWFAKIERSLIIRMMLMRRKTMVTRITSLEPLRRKQWKQFSRQRWTWILVSMTVRLNQWLDARCLSTRSKQPRSRSLPNLTSKDSTQKMEPLLNFIRYLWGLRFKEDDHQHWKGGRSEEKVTGKPNAEASYPNCHTTGVQVGFLLYNILSYQSIVYSLKDAVDQNIVGNEIK